jgi:hypothetical protein
MSTVTHLEQFRSLNQFQHAERVDAATKLRELWADSLATVAVVALASIVVFETLRVLLW